MSKILVVGDIHYKGDEVDKTFNNLIYNLYEDYMFDNLILLGDVIDNPTKININTISEMYSLFKFINKNNISVEMITGNHDLINGVNFFDLIYISEKANIISQPYAKITDNILHLFIPYHNNLPNEVEYLDKLKEQFLTNYINNVDKINTINVYTHNQYKENSTMFDKSIFEYYDFIFKTNGVSKKKINIISGHIHKHILKEITTNIKLYNIGCSISRSFNDFIEDVKYLLIDTTTGDIEVLSINPHTNKYNIKLPVYKTFNIKDNFDTIFSDILRNNDLITKDNIYININIDNKLFSTIDIEKKQEFFDNIAYINRIHRNKIKYTIKDLNTQDTDNDFVDMTSLYNFEKAFEKIDEIRTTSNNTSPTSNIIFDIIKLAIKTDNLNIKEDDIIDFINRYADFFSNLDEN